MWVRDMADESGLTAAELSSKIVSDITIYTKYAKYKEDLKRRTNWNEIVREVVDMHKRKYPALSNEIDAAFQFVIDKKVIPSMRSMQFAGKAIELGESRIYNCAFLPIDNRIAFREVMFLLMGGTGVGYSVQKHHIAKLPAIKQPESTHRFIISDTAEGWSDAVNRLCKAYFEGKSRPIFNYNDIRPEGSPLKKSGGKAPGPAKLKRTLNSIDNILRNAIGRKLSTVEVHDIVCYIASCVVSGGIRDSAMIALFSHDDNEMATCKGNFPVKVVEETASHIQVELDLDLAKQDQIGINAYGLNNYFFNKAELGVAEIKSIKTDGKMPWYYFHPQRGKANNSALLVRGDTTREEFFALWEKTKSSGAGEPAAYWSSSTEWGTNPCVEIALRPFQFCNLTSVNAATVTSQQDFEARVRAAAFIGTLQAGYTNFHYLRDIWRETTEKEALLGVSITGIAYNRLQGIDLAAAAKVGLAENERVASLIGIKKAARLACIKPEGSGSLALGVFGAGIHSIYDRFFIRRIRYNANDRLHQYLKQHVPKLVELDKFDSNKGIISIPVCAPEAGIFRNETAIEFCERVKKFSQEWVKSGHRRGQNTHNVSATIYVKPDEWEDLGRWMWDNKEYYNGLSCLPYDGGTYIQAPYEVISKEQYQAMLGNIHSIDLDNIMEDDDFTTLAAEKACAGGLCEF